MADDIPRDDATEVRSTEDPPAQAAQVSPLPAGGEGKSGEPDVSTSASTGKRPMEEDVVENGVEGADEGQHQDEEAEHPRKKARTGSIASGTIAEESSEVESEGASKEEASNSPDGQGTASSADHISTEPAPASGIGLRTSFGGGSQILSQDAHPDLLMHSPLTAEQRNQLVTAIRTGESKQVSPVKKRDLKWAVVPISATWVVGDTWLETFESMLDRWCEAFLARNQKNIDEIGLAPNLLKQAFLRRLDSDVAPNLPRTMRSVAKHQLKNPETSRLRNFATDFKPSLKKAAKRAAKRQALLEKMAEQTELEQQQQERATSTAANPPVSNVTALDTIKEGDQVNDSDLQSAQKHQQQSPGIEKEEGEVDSGCGDSNEVEIEAEETRPETPITQAELDQRHRYFPQVPDDVIFCLACARYGHATTRCPEATCKHCHGDHFKYECPTRQRCGKCKQLGHRKASCPEKLAVAQGEVAMECAICGLHDHTEINCSEVWDTYRPQPGSVNKVRSLPTFCYRCGSDSHFGGDCGLADPRIPPTKTWTIATASFYIDPASNEEALVYKQYIPPPPDLSAPVIPGRSIKPQSHVIFESDDSGGEADGAGFLHAPSAAGPANRRKQQQRPGTKIQIKSNINFGPGPSYSAQAPLVETTPGAKHGTSGRNNRRQQRGDKDFSSRDGSSAPRAGQDETGPSRKKRKPRQQAQAQQPPLPHGPPPPYRAEGSARGRGGFSGLSRRGRARRGQNQN